MYVGELNATFLDMPIAKSVSFDSGQTWLKHDGEGWVTSLKYSQNLKRVIAQHRLTSYDDRVLGKKDLEAVARDVIDGKYGNGEDRKRALRDAGYDPGEVQRIVNRMV